jgi:hypothetical protein
MRAYQHALMALLWSERDDDGKPLDSGDYEESQELRDKVQKDWDRFRAIAERLGFDAEEQCATMLHPDNEGSAWNAAALDFILTRNGHGTGFWDDGRWHTPWGDRLTRLCRKFGELRCYVGDDGRIYPE